MAIMMVKMRRIFLLKNMNVFKSKLLSVILVLGVGWLFLSFIKINLHENIVNKEVGDLNAKLDNLTKDNSSLEKFIEHLNNPSFLEKEVRLRLNYKAPDEEVVFIYPDNNARASSSKDFSRQNTPYYIRWWRYLIEN